MPISATGRSRLATRGFTLIEVMVVLVIIGVLITMTTLSVDRRSPEERLEKQAQQLQALVRLAREQAIVRGREVGLGFTRSGYRFFDRSPEGEWAPIPSAALRGRQLDGGTDLSVSMDGMPIILEETVEEPQVFLLPTDEMIPAWRAELCRETKAVCVELAPGEYGRMQVRDGQDW